MTDRPLPKQAPEATRYWEAARDGEFVYQYCTVCDRGIFPPRVACPYCLEPEPTWRQSDGRGTVYTYSVIHEPSIEWFEDRAPYAIAIIELADDVFVFGNVTGCEITDIRIGMPVRITFESTDSGVVLPQFKPS